MVCAQRAPLLSSCDPIRDERQKRSDGDESPSRAEADPFEGAKPKAPTVRWILPYNAAGVARQRRCAARGAHSIFSGLLWLHPCLG